MPDSNTHFKSDVSVVVLKMHHGSLAIARSLGRLGVPVYGLTAQPAPWAARSRYWRACYEYDIESSPAHLSVRYLMDLGERLGSMPLLIPVSDRTAEFVAEHSARLATRFRFPQLPRGLTAALTSKKEMYFLAKQCGIPTPETLFPASREDLVACLHRVRFPVMLKGIDGLRLRSRTGHTMVVAHSATELIELYDRMEDPANPNLMLQEYIPGGEDSVWMFNGYFDGQSRCLTGFTGRKIRQTPPYTGATSLGILLRNDDVAASTIAFMKAIGYRGIIDIGFRYDARDGLYKVLDVNPRIGSTFRLFVDRDGMDVVRALYRDLTGQPVPRAEQIEGRKWIVEDQDLYSCRRYRRDRKLDSLQWLASLRGIQEGAWFAWDDPRPFLLMCRSMLRSGARWMGRKLALPQPRRTPSRSRMGIGSTGEDP